LVAEARALRDSVSAAIHEGFDKIFIEGDNQVVIQALKSTINIPWQIASNIFFEKPIWQQIGYKNSDTPLLVHSPMMYVFHHFFEHYLLMMWLDVLL